MSKLFVASQEAHVVSVSEVLDVAIALIDKESLHKVVELLLVEMSSNVSEGVVRPVGMLNAVEESIVLSDPKAVLQCLKVS